MLVSLFDIAGTAHIDDDDVDDSKTDLMDFGICDLLFHSARQL